MAKSKEKFLARKLRRDGFSMGYIAENLKVSKSSVSLWCSDIQLTEKQVEKLHGQMLRGSYQGRMIGVQVQKDRKRKKIEECLLKASRDIPMLKKRELFMIGLGLYWGEGSKKFSVRFYNSDPDAVKLIMRWFRETLEIKEDRFMMYININQIHRERLGRVIEYWSEITGIKKSQFRKPSLIKTKNKKVYENFSEHYGTLCVRIAKSTDLLYQILGWLNVSSKN